MVDYTLVRSKRQTKKARLEARASSGPPNPNIVEKDGLTTSYKTHMRAEFTVATNPDNGTTMFNAYNAMKDFTEVLLSCDSNMVLRNQRNMDHTITKIEEFPAGQAAFKRFFTDGTMAGYKKDSTTIFFGFFIDCTYSDGEDSRFSKRNPGLWAYVKSHNIYLRSHGHETFTIQKVGFITMVPLKHIFRMDYENTYNEALAKEIQKNRKADDESYIHRVELRLASKAYAFQTTVEQDRARYAKGDTLEVLCENEQADFIRSTLTSVEGQKFGKFIPYGMGKGKDVYPIVIQEHNKYLNTIASFDVFEDSTGNTISLREMAETKTAADTEEGEVQPKHSIISIERTTDSAKLGRWRIVTMQDQLAEAKEHAQRTLVEKGMLTEECEESKHIRELSKITTNPQAQVFLSNHEESLISQAKYTGRIVSNPYRSKKKLVQIIYDAEEFPDLAGRTNQRNQQQQGYQTRPVHTQPQQPVQQTTGFGSSHPSNYGPQPTQQPTLYAAAAAATPATVAGAAKVPLVTPADKGAAQQKAANKSPQANVNCNLMEEDGMTVVSSGATAATINSMFLSFQAEMAKAVEAMFKQFTATLGNEALLDRIQKLENQAAPTKSEAQSEKAMEKIMDRLDEDKK
jgi:hypothetical protein